MGNIGTDGQEVNAKGYAVFIGSTANQWVYLQNARVLISHPIFREPTTGGGVKTFTGALDSNISGTLVFSRDAWNAATYGFKTLLIAASDDGEVPVLDWGVKFIDVSGSSTNGTLTFSGAKLSVVDISKSAEGGTKVDITVVCPSLPVTS
jgi:hypothetical protein